LFIFSLFEVNSSFALFSYITRHNDIRIAFQSSFLWAKLSDANVLISHVGCTFAIQYV